MEARAEFRQPRLSKGLVAIVAVSVTLGLGVMAGTVAKNLNGSAATTTQSHSISQGQGGPAFSSIRHSGLQIVEEDAAVTTAVGPDDRAGSPALAPIAGRGVSPDAADRKASVLTGNAFVAPDASDHKSQAAAASKPARSMEGAPGYRS
jgi:hypothetical protein